jgi:hypothetical protein
VEDVRVNPQVLELPYKITTQYQPTGIQVEPSGIPTDDFLVVVLCHPQHESTKVAYTMKGGAIATIFQIVTYDICPPLHIESAHQEHAGPNLLKSKATVQLDTSQFLDGTHKHP